VAIEFVEDRSSRTFFDPARKIGPTLAGELLKHGVISRAMPQGDILGFAPPLCINQAEIDTIVRATKAAIDAVLPA
jgi:L-2,4-diaminobutyrate transaminase